MKITENTILIAGAKSLYRYDMAESKLQIVGEGGMFFAFKKVSDNMAIGKTKYYLKVVDLLLNTTYPILDN